MICQFCKAEVTRHITKGPYCSVACKDHYEDEQEIASLTERNAELEADNEALRDAIEAAKAGGAL